MAGSVVRGGGWVIEDELSEATELDYHSNMGHAEIEMIGWEKSAVELVGEKLLEMEREEPDAFCRALVVVPTAERGRRLKEWIA